MFDQRIARYILVFTLAGGCAGVEEEPATRPNTAPDIVLVTIDTLRADRLGAYGDPLAQTPHLDALAKESALFTSAWTVAPLTMPAHTSLFLSLIHI